MIVNAVILIYGRPVYAHITLESLARSNIAKSGNLHLGAIIIDHPKFSVKAVRHMLGNYPFADCAIIEDKRRILFGSHSSRLAFMLGYIEANHLESDWFVFIEDDVIMNPDWFDRVLEMHEDASHKYKVGIISPLNNQFRGTLPGTYGKTFRGKKQFESQIWAMTYDVLQKTLDYSDELWTRWEVGIDKRIISALRADGYMSITANDSHAAHIGYVGNKGNIVSMRSRRYSPHPSVTDLYALAQSCKDGCGNGKEFVLDE